MRKTKRRWLEKGKRGSREEVKDEKKRARRKIKERRKGEWKR